MTPERRAELREKAEGTIYFPTREIIELLDALDKADATLLDNFAMAALTGMLASETAKEGICPPSSGSEDFEDAVAREAYDYAQSMLARHTALAKSAPAEDSLCQPRSGLNVAGWGGVG